MTTDISPLRELAIQAKNRFDVRLLPRLERSVGRVILFSLPETFAAHRAEFAGEPEVEKGVPSSFDCLAVDALANSLSTVKRLGTKEMPGDPMPMPRQVGDVYDKYQAQMNDPMNKKITQVTILDDRSLETLLDMSVQFQSTPAMVMALASENYAQQMKKQSSLPLTAS